MLSQIRNISEKHSFTPSTCMCLVPTGPHEACEAPLSHVTPLLCLGSIPQLRPQNAELLEQAPRSSLVVTSGSERALKSLSSNALVRQAASHSFPLCFACCCDSFAGLVCDSSASFVAFEQTVELGLRLHSRFKVLQTVLDRHQEAESKGTPTCSRCSIGTTSVGAWSALNREQGQ